ncbi:MAG TPA: hypothetical protein DEB39_08340 [Planctomycetaceae bacterium]|nr:hypothetical protein [Planctomycetaceae bacterium]
MKHFRAGGVLPNTAPKRIEPKHTAPKHTAPRPVVFSGDGSGAGLGVCPGDGLIGKSNGMRKGFFHGNR